MLQWKQIVWCCLVWSQTRSQSASHFKSLSSGSKTRWQRKKIFAGWPVFQGMQSNCKIPYWNGQGQGHLGSWSRSGTRVAFIPRLVNLGMCVMLTDREQVLVLYSVAGQPGLPWGHHFVDFFTHSAKVIVRLFKPHTFKLARYFPKVSIGNRVFTWLVENNL